MLHLLSKGLCKGTARLFKGTTQRFCKGSFMLRSLSGFWNTIKITGPTIRGRRGLRFKVIL